MMTKSCADCGSDKPTAEFPRNRNARSGYHSYCKTCHNQRNHKARVRIGPARQREYALRSKYGIDLNDHENMRMTQKGLCAICEIRPVQHTDHSHATGLVRGLLCNQCNLGLGQFLDHPEWLNRAALYVRKLSK